MNKGIENDIKFRACPTKRIGGNMLKCFNGKNNKNNNHVILNLFQDLIKEQPCIGFLRLNMRRTAGITVEVALSFIFTTVALFFVLSILADDLSVLAKNSGIHNIFAHKPRDEKASWNIPDTAQTRTIINVADASQTNVQTTSDQGEETDAEKLANYLSVADAVIKKYEETAPINTSQIKELAKALTEEKIGGNTSIDYNYYERNYGITVTANYYRLIYQTTITTSNGTKTLTFNSSESSLTYATDQVTAIKEVIKNDFS